MIKLDFHGSTHGHFLEYVINVWIFKTKKSASSIFNENGASHNVDNNYLQDRKIICGHFSRADSRGIEPNDDVIRITIDEKNDTEFFIAFTNLLYRAGDLGFEKQLLAVPSDILDNRVALRKNFYAKLNQRDLYANFYKEFSSVGNLLHKFPFTAFYSFELFCIALNELAFALDQTFFPDSSLFLLWQEFIAKNQGWHSYNHCNRIIKDIFSNADQEINCTAVEEAWINFNLSKICRIYSGRMFDEETYPACREIYQDIQQFLLTA